MAKKATHTNGKPEDPVDVLVEFPLGEFPADVPDGLAHIDVGIGTEQARALRLLTEGLDIRRATLRNGRRVANRGDAVRWILDQILETSEAKAALERAGLKDAPI